MFRFYWVLSTKRSNIKNLNLKIIGEGESLQKLIEGHQKENIEFLGKLENNEAQAAERIRIAEEKLEIARGKKK